ncbi:MAG: winged helix-turn-helix transcriptional regulator [Candidatus Heimdallarchaeota archaeon]|nr:winged helix-turn-helix transcriptional regulator [Candidatus Heimdallarchaeota archaeon]MCK4770730.1 winged helix-turn-helix transcriptional regulator [Candidatus Heimdallarchaeota archaeon]
MLTSDKERDMEKLISLWDSFKGIISETEERKRIVESIIANFETPTLKSQVRRLNAIYTSIASDARIFILLILSQFNAFHYELEYILGLSQPTISHHVHKLVNVGLVEQTKKVKIVFLTITKLGKIVINHIKEILRETSDVVFL